MHGMTVDSAVIPFSSPRILVSGTAHSPVVLNFFILFLGLQILPQQYESGDEYPRFLPRFLASSNFIRGFTNRILIADAII